jgi:hypothetical protein
MAFLDTLGAAFSTAPQQKASDAIIANAQQGNQAYNAAVQSGLGQMRTDYTSALAPWTGLQGQAQTGYNAYLDASGANGPEGIARAQGNFNAINQDFVNRGAQEVARTGVLNNPGGNAIAGVSDWTGKTLSGLYGDYVSRLNPFIGQMGQVAGGIAGINTALGNQTLNAYGNIGSSASHMYDTIGKAQSDAALADYNASKNMWGAIQSGANLAAAAMGGGGGFGSLLSGASSLFGGAPTQVGQPQAVAGAPAMGGATWQPNGMGGYSPTYG